MIIYNILMMGLSSAIMYLFAQLFYKRQKYAKWYYLMLITSLLMLILPLHLFRLPKIFKITVPENISDVVYFSAENTVSENTFNISAVIFLIWLIISAALIIFTAVKYIFTRRMLFRISTSSENTNVLSAYKSVKSAMHIKRRISIRTSSGIDSPLLFGIIQPVILVPNRSFSDNELEMIMAHELTHYKNHDLLIKLIMSFAKYIHWFNPFTYMLAKSLNKACELCCDEAVLSLLEPEDKKAYGKLIISVIESAVNRKMVFTTAMASPKKDIQNRLIKIVEFRKPSRIIKAICTMLLVSVAICSVTAFGIEISKEIIPEEVVEIIDKAVDTPTISEIFPVSSPKPADDITSQQATEKPKNTKAPQRTNKPQASTSITPSPAPVHTTMPQTSQAPMPEPTNPVSETPHSNAAQKQTETPKRTPVDNNTPDSHSNDTSKNSVDLNLSVNSAKNLKNESVTDFKKEIIIKAKENEFEKGENVTVYVRPDGYNSYDVIYYEKD